MRIFAIFLLTILFPFQAFARSESWQFVQSVGGIAIETPRKNSTGWAIPVRVDVSGLTTITVKPTLLNSALACVRTIATVEGQAIYITVVTGLIRSGVSPLCTPALLGNVVPGKYRVYYRGPDEKPIELSEVKIGL